MDNVVVFVVVSLRHSGRDYVRLLIKSPAFQRVLLSRFSPAVFLRFAPVLGCGGSGKMQFYLINQVISEDFGPGFRMTTKKFH
jgi:hypothetical protein